MNARRNWKRVTKPSPCPICSKPDFCIISGDGSIVGCTRSETGCFKSKQGQNGGTIYYHRLNGTRHQQNPSPQSTKGPAAKRADPEIVNQVYSALLGALKLSKTHRENLRKRGLADVEIDNRGYRSLPIQGRTKIAGEIREQFGKVVLQVPGFVVKEEDGRQHITIAGWAGLLVPVRDNEGQIVALKVRRNDEGQGPRYVYLSSTGRAGPGPGAPVHIPQGIHSPVDTVRMTEGELKADIALALSGLPTISIPGVSNWRPGLDVLKKLEVKTVRLAFDADVRENVVVGRYLLACAEELLAQEFVVELECWDPAHKGIDDFLVANGTPVVHQGDDAMQVLRAMVSAPCWECWPGSNQFEDVLQAEVIVVSVGLCD